MTPTLTRFLMLVAFIALPLVGVLLLGWDWREIVLLYWLENVSLGIAMFIKLLRSAKAPGGDDPSVVKGLSINGQPVYGPGAGVKLAGFFVMHYGGFTFVHGIFVLLLVGGVMLPPGLAPESAFLWWGALLVWIIGGTVQVLAARLGPMPQLRGTMLMFSAYPRIIVLHVGIILGIILIVELQWGPAAAVLLIALHAVVDVVGWMISAAIARHRSRAAQPAEPRP
ncbi:MAG: hypothetical protein KIT89_06180 [Microcella sp.]|uniref:DUF6498-containing protein n=1 Tax=Microcella sp. TaxID=1913979 RepID=UPI0024CB2EBB|nr:DUF6498-containing protein [Microcella sp.]UYN84746.1 MAG: hypothetical protein KIT89_06180 [Microcella sp.]